MKTPRIVKSLSLDTTCVQTTGREYDRLMEGCTVANKSYIDRLVMEHLPVLYTALSLNLRNPYQYYKTKTHLILIHSAVNYFLLYE